MSKKPMTVEEMSHLGGVARAKAHSKAQIREWGEQGGRPAKVDSKAVTRLKDLLASGKTQAECAEELGVSVRTIGRILARIKASERKARL